MFSKVPFRASIGEALGTRGLRFLWFSSELTLVKTTSAACFFAFCGGEKWLRVHLGRFKQRCLSGDQVGLRPGPRPW